MLHNTTAASEVGDYRHCSGWSPSFFSFHTSGTCVARVITVRKLAALANIFVRSAMPSSKNSHWYLRMTLITQTTSTASTAGQFLLGWIKRLSDVVLHQSNHCTRNSVRINVAENCNGFKTHGCLSLIYLKFSFSQEGIDSWCQRTERRALLFALPWQDGCTNLWRLQKADRRSRCQCHGQAVACGGLWRIMRLSVH